LVAKNGDFARDTGMIFTGTLKMGRVVTSIGHNAFQRSDLTGLDLSDATALETIGDWAFYYNNQLTGTLKVGPTVTSIGHNAFSVTSLTGLDLSEATALVTTSATTPSTEAFGSPAPSRWGPPSPRSAYKPFS